MSDQNGAPIDPRYDPAFQRGFEGEVTTAPRGQSTLRRTAAVNPAPARPVAQQLEESPRAADVATPRPPVEELAEAKADADAAAPVAPSPTATPRELARNPFVIALAALAVVLVIGGAIWAYEGFATIVRNGGTRNEVEYWAAQTMSFGAPLTIIVGVAVVAALLVLFGRSWQRSHRSG